MTVIYRVLLVAVIAILGTQASAQSHHWGRYEMVTTYTDRVAILDKQTGELWVWSEPSAIMYVGKIFPMGGAGSIARIILVNPEGDGR
jgi:hypothetical protein